MNADTAGPIIRGERGEQLNDLSIDVERDETAPTGVESCHGTRLVVDRALEGIRRPGLEAEEKAPERTDEQGLECGSGSQSDPELKRLAERSGRDSTRAEADHEGEQEAR